MTLPNLPPLSVRSLRRLILAQSVLTTAQFVAAAGIAGDWFGAKVSATAVVCVAAVQQGVNFYISKSVGQAGEHMAVVSAQAQSAAVEARQAIVDATTVERPNGR